MPKKIKLIAKLEVELDYRCKGSLCKVNISKLWNAKSASFSVENDNTLRILLKKGLNER